MFRSAAVGFWVILAMSVSFVTSGCGLITPANYIAGPRIHESHTPFCYRQASRLVTRCDYVQQRSDEDLRVLLNSTQMMALRTLGEVH